MAKYGMSMCVLGMAEEFKEEGIAVNALWPKTGKLASRMAVSQAGLEDIFLFLAAKPKIKISCVSQTTNVKIPVFVGLRKCIAYGAAHCDKLQTRHKKISTYVHVNK
jgi:NAD(P)-dependent dehydrogenase (short-subunit alcohol dehydrogenase family)